MSVQLTINEKTQEADSTLSLFEHAERVDVRVPTSCLKNGKCKECMVEVVEGMELLSARTEAEAHLDGRFRLSCRTRVVGAQGAVCCHTMRRGQMVIAEGGKRLDHILVDTPMDPAVTRRGRSVLIDGKPICESSGPILGIAADIGTTTVVLRLVDLETGRVVEVQSFENPQRFGGSDVMARIQYDTDHKGRLLQRTLLGYMTHAIESFDCQAQDIYEMVVAGNATMRDLFFGLDVYSIGQRPYQSLTEKQWQAGERDTTAETATTKRLRLPINPAARIYGLPLVRGHVGADAAACILAIDLPREHRMVALMDIGTNTELIVGHKDKVYAASCPAGPAFEGGVVACGMPGLEGAIESVRLGNGSVRYQVIGGGDPQGICGSGLVESLSELLRMKRMDHFGRLKDGADRFVLDEEHRIFLSEADISELAQAKGANVAGLRIVLSQYGSDFEHIDCFYLAGGFAQHMDVGAAKRMGLIPDLPDGKIMQIGNAAIEGATIALKSVKRRRELEDLLKEVTHVELETDPHFFEHFVEGCQFKAVKSVG